MARITYPSTSPYASSTQTSWYLGKYQHRPIPSAPDDQNITITAQYVNRPDKLSNDLYGTPAYWWVFAVRNRNLLNDPVWDMTNGLQIKAPTLASLRKALGT